MATKALLWLDLETTGSDPRQDPILEIGIVHTDLDLRELGSLSLIVEMTDLGRDRLDALPVVKEMHLDNGLISDCERKGIQLRSAAHQIENFMSGQSETFSIQPKEWLLAGSGVSHFDRGFVKEQLPQLDDWLNYACLDIGVLRRALWLLSFPKDSIPTVPESAYMEEKAHRALADALAHLKEARAFRQVFSGIQFEQAVVPE